MIKAVAKYIFQTWVALLILLIAVGLVFWQTTGTNFYSVKDNSMAPVLSRGDLVITEKVQPLSIKVGDIISLPDPQNSANTITHRVAHIDKTKNLITTGGDNVTQNDP